jgi:hypothetical protein
MTCGGCWFRADGCNTPSPWPGRDLNRNDTLRRASGLPHRSVLGLTGWVVLDGDGAALAASGPSGAVEGALKQRRGVLGCQCWAGVGRRA